MKQSNYPSTEDGCHVSSFEKFGRYSTGPHRRVQKEYVVKRVQIILEVW